jgi:cell wall-associated NlpC family hydrolase
MALLLKEIELETGDLILFRGTSFISKALEYVGQSKYSHVGIILKNPRFLNENFEDGLYLLDSSFNTIPDEEDHQLKYGVQIHKLDDILALYSSGSVYMRKIKAIRNEEFYEKFRTIHTEIYNKPYDLNIYDWIEAKLNLSNCGI